MLERAREGTTSRFVLGSIWRAHRVRLLCALVLQLVYSGIQFAGPLLLNQIIKFLSTPEPVQTVGVLCCAVLCSAGRQKQRSRSPGWAP